MKAMYINAPGQVEIKDVEMPVRKEGEVLLKLLYGGICGSDLGSYRGGQSHTFRLSESSRAMSSPPKSSRSDDNDAYGPQAGHDRDLQPVLQLRTLLFLRARHW